MHVARVVVHAVVGLMLVLIARVIVIVFVVEFPVGDGEMRWLSPNFVTVTFAPNSF